jgi:predicted PurR-regulated permease PerM
VNLRRVGLNAPSPAEPEAATAPAPEASPHVLPVPIDIHSLALMVLAILGIVLMLKYAEAMIIPIVLGLLISYALDPLVTGLARLRVPRAVGAAVVLLLVVGVGSSLLYQLRDQTDAIVQELPEAARRLRRALEREKAGGAAPSTIAQVQKAATELEKAADAAGSSPPPRPGVTRVQVEQAPVNISAYVMWGSFGIAAAVVQVLLILFLAYFSLASGDLYKRKLVKIVGPSLSRKRITVQILEDIDRQIAKFLFVQVATSAAVGIATWMAFLWIGLEQAAVWGLLAGVFNTIPYFGPVIVTATAAVVAFLQFGTIKMALIAGGAAFAITTVEGMGLTPWLTGRAARMNAVAVFVGLLFWGWVWGIWGMLLAVPMLMIMKAVCDHVEDFKGFGELLGD